MLALSFLLLIGAALIADGMHFHIPRQYIYFAMAFAAAVEVVNVLACASAALPGTRPKQSESQTPRRR